MTWEITSARLTLFATPAAERVEAPSWQVLVGAPPESRLERVGRLRAESGSFGRGRLQLQNQQIPRRIDFVYVPAPSTSEGEMPILGTFEEVVRQVRGPWDQLLKSGIETVRIALGYSHLQRTPDWDAAYRIVQEALGPTRVNLNGVRDFMYRINRQRDSAVIDRLLINRLATWSGVVFQELEVNMASGEASTSRGEAYGAALETDFSTDQDRRDPIPSGRLIVLLDELHRLTAELAIKGDIP